MARNFQDRELVRVVCTASAYVRSSGNLHTICSRRYDDSEESPRTSPRPNAEPPRVHLTLVDDSSEKAVTMISENIGNIGLEFANLEGLDCIEAEDSTSLHAACMCAAQTIRKAARVEDGCRVVLLIDEYGDEARTLLQDVIADGHDGGVRTRVCCVSEPAEPTTDNYQIYEVV